MKNRPLVSAALLGLGGGLRSFAPPVALALRVAGPSPDLLGSSPLALPLESLSPIR
jgi:hypothetical protein